MLSGFRLSCVQNTATNFLKTATPISSTIPHRAFSSLSHFCQKKVPSHFTATLLLCHTMADTFASAALPPPPSTAGAPGVDSPPGANGTSHLPPMPPPTLPPVVIPQNNNNVPQQMSATTPSGGKVTRAAPEPNKRALYVGGLDPRVTEDVLRQIFETTGHVQSVKIIPDKNVSPPLQATLSDASF